MALAANDFDVKAWKAGRKSAQWDASRNGMLAAARRNMDRLGLSGMEENPAQERIAALHELDRDAFKNILDMEPAETRESAIQALVRAHTRNGQVIYLGGKAYEPDQRECKLQGCSVWFKVTPNRPHQMYCSEAHRKRGERDGRD